MILGIDWGEKKIGLAIAHEEVAIASAIDAIRNDGSVFDALAHIINMYDVQRIVIGKSAHLSQHDNVEKIDAFGALCAVRLQVPIVYMSEIFSTREAQENLKAAGRKNLAERDDSEAARIILQSYMDAHHDNL